MQMASQQHARLQLCTLRAGGPSMLQRGWLHHWAANILLWSDKVAGWACCDRLRLPQSRRRRRTWRMWNQQQVSGT